MANVNAGGGAFSPGPSDPQSCCFVVQANAGTFAAAVVLFATEESTVTFHPVGNSGNITATFTGLLPVFVDKVTAVTGTVLALSSFQHTY